ncbi:MAG: hypothetical protein KJ638_02520 [Chloroflexi bacterium]|nr:hypothetical protein [Chloroflexota bacterium]
MARYREAGMEEIHQIDTGGGAYTEGDVDTGGGDFIGRDKIVAGTLL